MTKVIKLKIVCRTNNLELYDLSHLKLSQLIIDGDVESNPGPVNNNNKGRSRPKRKSFPGKANTPKVTPVLDNKFLKYPMVIQLKDIRPWDQMCRASTSTSQFRFMPNKQ